MTSVEEVIPSALAGERVDRATAMITGLSRAVAARLIDAGSVRLDGNQVNAASRRVAEGQRITIDLPEIRETRPAPDPTVQVPIVHEDRQFVVVDKPTGMVVHPGAGHGTGTLVHGLLAVYPALVDVGDPSRPGIVHRLDRGTSGLLVVARTQAAYDDLVGQMQRREPRRVYTALVWGHPKSDAGTIEAPVGRSTRHRTRMTVTDQGRDATTHYEVDHRFDRPKQCALLTCRLETGRTHQIRVHLRAIDHPVVGDRDYNGGRPGLELQRPFLHARELSFAHPTSGETVSFECPLPPDLVAVLAALGD